MNLYFRFNSIGVGGFIFADQFLQISSILPSNNLYGLGSHQTSLKLNTSWQILTFFNADVAPTEKVYLQKYSVTIIITILYYKIYKNICFNCNLYIAEKFVWIASFLFDY